MWQAQKAEDERKKSAKGQRQGNPPPFSLSPNSLLLSTSATHKPKTGWNQFFKASSLWNNMKTGSTWIHTFPSLVHTLALDIEAQGISTLFNLERVFHKATPYFNLIYRLWTFQPCLLCHINFEIRGFLNVNSVILKVKLNFEISALFCVRFLPLNRNTARDFQRVANVTSRELQMPKQFWLFWRETSSVRKDTLYQIQSSDSWWSFHFRLSHDCVSSHVHEDFVHLTHTCH